MTLIPVDVRTYHPDQGEYTITVTGDRVSEHFPITPIFQRCPDGTHRFTDQGRLGLTHIPSGLLITHAGQNLRRLATELENLDDIDWSTADLHITTGDIARVKATVNNLYRVDFDDDYQPGSTLDPNNPVDSLIGRHLDTEFKHSTSGAADELSKQIADHDPKLARTVSDALAIARFTETRAAFTLVSLLTILDRTDPGTAKYAAGLLASADTALLVDLLDQWRHEHNAGLPLTIPGIPDIALPVPDSQQRSRT
ncbi:hypothetical protein [Nocardia farcinica]|uniref:hypothetical protein n=1 Tax=Nocardia farcinica TaxID=37329 RepID=UPI002458841C|nr:hypothetical protein [Nocardia farcinica]